MAVLAIIQENYQLQDVIVISDECEICNKIERVLDTGHFNDHTATYKRRERTCPGSGLLAQRVIAVIRADQKRSQNGR